MACITDPSLEALATLIQPLLVKQQAVLIAHYYTDPAIQALAEQTGGCVADSLEMARFGANHPANVLLIAGVRFMGETAKILSPKKRVLMLTNEASCSLDIGCPIEEFDRFCDDYPTHEVVVYANTSAAVKARADWVVTSSMALDLIDYLDSQNKKILWAPDQHLGRYLQEKTGADMILWNGSCTVHDEFKAEGLRHIRNLYPNAAVLVHPEAPLEVIAQADVVGSTSQLIAAAKKLLHPTLIVATEQGIFYKLQQACPDKTLVSAPTGGVGAACLSCARCPWMKLNCLENIAPILKDTGSHEEISIEASIRERALLPLEKMLHFSKELRR